MILEHLPRLQHAHVVLASGSPRRAELLQQQGLVFEVRVSSFAEDLAKDNYVDRAAEYARETAVAKAEDVARSMGWTEASGPHVIISADTVVEHGGRILEKPADEEEAVKVLMSLSGDVHHVHSGVALVLPHIPDASSRTGHLVRSFSETTSVRFDDLSEQAIRAYVATGEPFDKAGSYGIQGKAGVFVRGIEGCYFNVMGLPINRLARELSALIDDGLL